MYGWEPCIGWQYGQTLAVGGCMSIHECRQYELVAMLEGHMVSTALAGATGWSERCGSTHGGRGLPS